MVLLLVCRIIRFKHSSSSGILIWREQLIVNVIALFFSVLSLAEPVS